MAAGPLTVGRALLRGKRLPRLCDKIPNRVVGEQRPVISNNSDFFGSVASRLRFGPERTLADVVEASFRAHAIRGQTQRPPDQSIVPTIVPVNRRHSIRMRGTFLSLETLMPSAN